MSHHLERAQLLLAQSRPADAEREVLQALSQAPDEPQAHALLALTRVEQNKAADALASAEAAVGLAPDAAYFHYVHGFVLHRLEREKEARTAVESAIRLDPYEADHFTLLASIELALRNWPAALAAAEQGLAVNPEHVQAANCRAMALVRLGRKDEAMDTVDRALERAPESAFSHANQGWNCLHRNDPKRAQEHFKEALRLSPDLEYARQGMLEALKARNPIYRGMLAYFLWMGRLSGKLQWVFIIGTFFGVRVVRTTAERNPQLGWVLWPILILFYLFIYLSWTAGPMFNLLLRFNRFGRLVLSRDETTASNWFALFFLPAVAGLGWWAFRHEDTMLWTTVVCAALSICSAATFNRTGRARKILGAASAALLAIGGFAVWSLTHSGDLGMLNLFFIGFLGFQILANTVQR